MIQLVEPHRCSSQVRDLAVPAAERQSRAGYEQANMILLTFSQMILLEKPGNVTASAAKQSPTQSKVGIARTLGPLSLRSSQQLSCLSSLKPC